MSPGNDAAPRRATEGHESVAGGNTENFTEPADNIGDFGGLSPEQSRIMHHWLADSCNIRAENIGFAVLVQLSATDGTEPRYRRRLFLTLHAAEKAVERAARRGMAARVQLVELRPLGGAS